MTAPKDSKQIENYILKFLRQKRILVFVFLILSVLINAVVSWGNNAGEDITSSRNNFLSSERNNFLGAFASLFYGSIPENLLHWWQWLLLVQGILCLIGLLLFFENEINNGSKRRVSSICGFSYIVIFIGMAPTRDGAMISFAILGLGLIQKRKGRPALLSLGLLAICISCCFRPWLSPAFAPIIYPLVALKIKRNKAVIVFACIPILAFPILLENVVKNLWELDSAYPQQTVMIHDVTSSYCLSTSQSIRDIAYIQLEQIAESDESLLRICEFYKPSTWQAVTVKNLKDSRISHLSPPISIIQPEQDKKFEALQSTWANLIIRDPGTYIQNHMYFLTQILISGESAQISFLSRLAEFNSSHKPVELVRVLISPFQIPVQILIRLHLLSPLVAIFALMVIQKKFKYMTYPDEISGYSIKFTVWILITTIGFVSDNGRYTYLPVVMIWASFLKLADSSEIQKV